MAFQVLEFSPASKFSQFKIIIEFNTGFWDWLLLRQRYSVLFYYNGSNWFQRRVNYPEFICDSVTEHFLDHLRVELENEFRKLSKPARKLYVASASKK